MDRKYVPAYRGKANVLRLLKRYEEALATFDEALSLNPSSATLYTEKGNVLFALKRFEEAITAYERATQLQPDFGFRFW